MIDDDLQEHERLLQNMVAELEKFGDKTASAILVVKSPKGFKLAVIHNPSGARLTCQYFNAETPIRLSITSLHAGMEYRDCDIILPEIGAKSA